MMDYSKLKDDTNFLISIENKKTLYWNTEYLDAAEHYLHNDFDQLYNDVLSKQFYKNKQQRITRKQFISKIMVKKSNMEKGSWLFNPYAVR